MREFFKKYHILMKLLALLIAVGLWVLVIDNVNPERTTELAAVPLKIDGESDLLREQGLVISHIENTTVKLTLSGAFNALSGANYDTVTARADVSNMNYTEPGEYLLTYAVSLPNGVAVRSRTPSTIPITVEQIVEKELPVRVEYEGTLAEGIYLDEATVEPASVLVSGTESIMALAEYAIVKIDAAELTVDYTGDCEYIIADAEGQELVSDFTRKTDRTVAVEIPVYMTRVLGLDVNVLASTGVPSVNVVTVCEPSEVEVYGRADAVKNLRTISLGEISVRDFVLTYEKNFEISLPEGVEFVEGQATSADVYVSLRDIETTAVNVTSITIQNTPENIENVELVTTNLDVQVRAQTDKLKSITADNFNVLVDLADITLTEGEQIVPAIARSSLSGYDIYGTYSVIINVTLGEQT